jgi:hypothetical protein
MVVFRTVIEESTLLKHLSVDRYILSGEKIVPPGAKRGLIPVVVPLSESPTG